MEKSILGPLPEFWLRGPIAGVPSLLQPAAHALLQSGEELVKYTMNFPDRLLWERPADCASVGFHIRHITGVLDRMLTYAQGRPLSEAQFEYLRRETEVDVTRSVQDLIRQFDLKVEEALFFFKGLSQSEMTLTRTVGRKKLPSTVIGLLFHAAEHSQRHVGQLLVTARILQQPR